LAPKEQPQGLGSAFFEVEALEFAQSLQIEIMFTICKNQGFLFFPPPMNAHFIQPLIPNI
jgi:hypothetical protein